MQPRPSLRQGVPPDPLHSRLAHYSTHDCRFDVVIPNLVVVTFSSATASVNGARIVQRLAVE
jgi:hypothetical protein